MDLCSAACILAADVGLDALTGLIVGSVVAISLAAFRLLEHVIVKRYGGGAASSSSSGVTWSARDREVLNNVARIVSQCDPEGVPLAYVPRRFLKLTERQAELTTSIVALIERQTNLAQVLHDHLTAHEAREEEELREIRKLLERFVA